METPRLSRALIIIMQIAFLAILSCNPSPVKEKPVAASPVAFQWEHATPESVGLSTAKLDVMKDSLAKHNTKKLMIVKNDKIVYEWYAPGWKDDERKHYSASLAKAVMSGMSLLAALDDGYIYPDEAVCELIPSWKANNVKSKITVRQLATHTSGMVDAEPNEEEIKFMNGKGLDHHMDLPGWRGQFWRKEPDPFSIARDSTPLATIPGEEYAYSNPGIAMLNYAVTASLEGSKFSDLRTYLRERVYRPIGITENDYSIGYEKTYDVGGLKLVAGWGGGAYTARALGRIGLLMLHKGNWMGRQIFDTAMVEKVTAYDCTAFSRGTENEGSWRVINPSPASTMGWYSNYDGIWPSVPRDAFAGGGAGNQHLFVIPGMKMVIVRMGDDLYNASAGEGFWYGPEKYLLNPLMDAVTEAPYPESDLKAEFAPAGDIIRLAEGCDNWPATWADDDNIYTAWGDGNGFIPNTDIKLSLGLARVEGTPPGIHGFNVRSLSGERVGQGKYGEKASGMLMVDNILYMLTRNSHNARLLWSDDHGESWQAAPWRFKVSFGCPTFLQYGKNYAGAPDRYVYIYSNDDESAYMNSDRFVLARVPKDKIKNRDAYEFYAGNDHSGNPAWTDDIRKRGAVFTNPGKCYRSGITYDKGLKRYLWCQAIQLSPSQENKGVRFRGGLGIFESENPWGPWRTVYYTRDWDTGPGETSSIPAKWMSDDGRSAYFLFSGDDYFSLREVRFTERDKR